YYCVYCKKTSRRFMHEGVKADVFKKYRVAGGGYKRNVRCPHCMSTDRSRLLYLFFQYRTQIFKRQTELLHISPNHQVARMLSEHATVNHICGAIEPEHFQEFHAVKVDIQNIPFEKNIFDVAV